MRRTGGSAHPSRGQDAREQRKREQDRRGGLDRRGDGVSSAARSRSERPYGFRDFEERRDRQDRRLYCGAAEAGPFVYLTREELAALLSQIVR